MYIHGKDSDSTALQTIFSPELYLSKDCVGGQFEGTPECDRLVGCCQILYRIEWQ